MRFFGSKKNPEDPLNATRAVSIAYPVFDKMFMARIASMRGALPDPMVDGMEGHVHVQSAKLAWMTVLLIKQQTDRLFRSRTEFDEFVTLGSELIKLHLADPEFEGSQGKEHAAVVAADGITDCIGAVDATITNFVKEAKLPMTPIYQVIETKFPFASVSRTDIKDTAQQMEAVYGPILRSAVTAVRQLRK